MSASEAGYWKLLCRFHEAGIPQWELFNLKDDPSETKNVAAAHPELVNRLERDWRVVNNRMIPPYWAQGGRVLLPEERKATRELFNVPGRSVP